MCTFFKNLWKSLVGDSNTAITTPLEDGDITSESDGSMLIVVINKSNIISNDEVKKMTRAVAIQAREHAAKAWDVKPPKVVYRSSEQTAEAGSLKVLIFDDADTAGALGYHDDGPDGLPYGKVFVKISQKYNIPVSSVLSHEVLEMMLDPQANYWADNWNDNLSYALELADPVEGDLYTIDVNGAPVSVSNFVLPAWFDPIPPKNSKFDWLGKLTKPITMTKGGYVIIRDQNQVKSVFGASYPDWKKELKLNSISRTKKRNDKCTLNMPQKDKV